MARTSAQVSDPEGPLGQQRPLRYANEGSLRIAFEGPQALVRGRYRLRFRPPGVTLSRQR